jgi:hypothetical protein
MGKSTYYSRHFVCKRMDKSRIPKVFVLRPVRSLRPVGGGKLMAPPRKAAFSHPTAPSGRKSPTWLGFRRTMGIPCRDFSPRNPGSSKTAPSNRLLGEVHRREGNPQPVAVVGQNRARLREFISGAVLPIIRISRRWRSCACEQGTRGTGARRSPR